MGKYSPYILYLLIPVFVVLLYVNEFSPMNSLQRSLDDFLSGSAALDGKRPNVALIMIDDRSQDSLGEWPWDYDLVADLAAATASAEPGGIVLDFDLPESSAQDSAGFTDILAGQLTWIENVVLSFDIGRANYRSGKTSNPKALFNNAVNTNNPLGILGEDASLLARKVFLPAEKLLVHKPYLGFDYDLPDDDHVLRRQPLIMNYEGYYYPSQSLLAAAIYLGVRPQEIILIENDVIQLGGQRTIPIGKGSQLFIRFSGDDPFVTYSAADVLGEGFNFSNLKDKLVLIGIDDPRYSESFPTPVDEEMPAIWIKATVIENIINGNTLVVAENLAILDLLILFVLGAVCAYILPRIVLMHRLVVLTGILIVLGNVNYFMVSSFGLIPHTVYIALQLLLCMIASPVLDMQAFTSEKPLKSPQKAKKLTKAKIKRPVESPEDVPAPEIKVPAVEPVSVETPAYKDKDSAGGGDNLPVPDHQTITPNEGIPIAAANGTGGQQDEDPEDYMADHSALDLPVDPESEALPAEFHDSDGVSVTKDSSGLPSASEEVKNLGRYQITGILGKGAMGLVYKGIDPAINRPVALKTIRLDFVADLEEMNELKERLFREAQAAGKLSHPNIVTIYDVGSEDQLQYIAMECLEGQTLENMIKKKVKFNYRIITQIISQICSALDYAHELGIVHRDVKPANIMILNDYRIKVMDFGIARIDSSSMTKTGIAMGTPNYISPEQLKSMPIDRRADIFSLGVVMYEMLLGRRPFKGENITSLIYAIMNNEPEKPSNVNPQIPLLFDHVIMKALEKEPAERYQKASEITTALADFMESFAAR